MVAIATVNSLVEYISGERIVLSGVSFSTRHILLDGGVCGHEL